MSFTADPVNLPQCSTLRLSWTGNLAYPARLEIYAQNGTAGWDSTPYLYDVNASSTPFELQPAVPAGLTLWATLTDNQGHYYQIGSGVAITASTDSSCLTAPSSDADLFATMTVTKTDTITTTLSLATVTAPAPTSMTLLGRPQLPGGNASYSNSVSYDSAGPGNWTANSNRDHDYQRDSSSNLPSIIGGTLGSLLALAVAAIIFPLLLVRRIKQRQRAPLRPPMRRMFGADSSSTLYSLDSAGIHPNELTPQPSLNGMAETARQPEFVVSRSPTQSSFNGLLPALLSPPLRTARRDQITEELLPVSSLYTSPGPQDIETGSMASNGTLRSYSGLAPRLFATNASHQDSLNQV